MKVVAIAEPGGPEVLKIEERSVPKAGIGEVLIRVSAFGINRPDIAQREGRYPAPNGVPEDILGLEVAGFIEAVGEGVERWKTGDKVCALLAGGGYAEYAVAPAEQCLPIPENLSFEEVAALPETFFTVWTNVFDRAHFQKGETVLIHGGTSGIGVAAIQMIKAMEGQVAVTVGSEEKRKVAEDLGADLVINYKTQDFEEVIKEQFEGVDIILDMIGGDYTPKNIRLLNEEGRMVIINAMKGRMAELDLMRVMVKRLTITGSTLRARDPEFKGQIARKLEEHIWPFLVSGEIKSVINRTFEMGEIQQAHQLLESGDNIGKIVVSNRK